jgi:hypothetical protein
MSTQFGLGNEPFRYEINVYVKPGGIINEWTVRVSTHSGFRRWGLLPSV